MTADPVHLQVLLFARASELAGAERLTLELPAPACVDDVVTALGERAPGLAPYLAHCRISVNREFCSGDAPVPDGGEIAVIPPVSGGSPGGIDRDRGGSPWPS